KKRLGIVELGRNSRMAHFLDQDHGGFLIEHLVDGDHLAQLHQVLDDFGGLEGHFVRKFGYGDGFRHVNFACDELGDLWLAALGLYLLTVATTATPAFALALACTGAPAVTAGAGWRSIRACCRFLATGLVRPG